MPTVPIFYEYEIPDSYRNIFVVKTQLMLVDFSDKLISNNFSHVKTVFRFHKKSEQLALIHIGTLFLTEKKMSLVMITSTNRCFQN